AEEAVDLARLHVEADAVDCREAAVLLDEIADDDHLAHSQQADRRGIGMARAPRSGACLPTRIGVEFGASSTSSTSMWSRRTSGRMAACLSRPPRASRKCVASAGNWFRVGSTGSQSPRPSDSARYTSGQAW